MKKEKIIMFFCPKDLTYFYLYGSQIQFKNDAVYFQNQLLSPGERLIVWENRECINGYDKIPAMLLPSLKTEYNYALNVNGNFSPSKSIFLSLIVFNKQNEQIYQKSFIQKNDTFSLPSNTDSYRLEIRNFGNKNFVFNYLIIASKKFARDLQVKLMYLSSLRIIVINQPNKNDQNIAVHFIKKSEVIQELAFCTNMNHLFICISQDFTGKLKLTEKQINSLVNYLEKLRKEQFCLHIDENATSLPLIKNFVNTGFTF